MRTAGGILRYARRHAGMTQRELALATGVPQPAIARIERAAVSPRLDTLDRLLAATRTTLEPMAQLGVGIDRSQIRSRLALDPEDRVRSAGADGRNLAALLAAVGRDSQS
jgi:transcriptional regulator with XRE-family HTH domain